MSLKIRHLHKQFNGIAFKASLFLCFGFVCFSLYNIFMPINLKGKSVLIDVPVGMSFNQLADKLAKTQLIRKSFYFKALVRLYGSPVLQMGEYYLSQKDSLWFQFQKIKQGHTHHTFVTFPEGLNHYEMAEILKSTNWQGYEKFLKLVWDKNFIQKLLKKDFPSLEGYLFPDTYDVSKYMSAETVLTRMVQNFLKHYQPFSLLPTRFSRHQAVTFASLIEKETTVPKERFLISSVFYNRLKRKMKLQTDPTILYSLYLDRGFFIKKNIRKKDILFSSPYNTYVVYGLPKGPIANPGTASLNATFNPLDSEYLYFVSRNDGTHVFSKSYSEHKAYVYKYQILPFKKTNK